VERPGGAGRRPDQVKAVGRGASNAGVRPPRGRRRVEQGEHRAREREGRGKRAALLAGPKGRRVGPAAPVPFLFFFEFLFSNSFYIHLDYLKITFTFFSQNKSCSKTKTLQLCFNKQGQIPNRI